MSAPVKTSPEGVDIKIQALQLKLHTALSSEWDTVLYDSYGRAYRNPTKDGYKLELYDGSNEYSGSIYINDNKAALSFFYIQDTDYENHHYISTVDIVFFVNLAILKSSVTHRADTEVREDVYELLKCEPSGFKVQSQVIGVENVFNNINVENIKYDDLQPYHVFKFVTIVNHR